jgi:hypothetical protein
MSGASHSGFDVDRYSHAESSVMDTIHNQFGKVYTEAKCSTNSSAPLSEVDITCTNADGEWFESFVNLQCSVGADSLDSVQKCVDTYGDTSADGSDQAYCTCRGALVAKINQFSQPLEIAAQSLALFEFLLLIFACQLVCSSRKKKENVLAEPLYTDQNYHQAPSGGPMVSSAVAHIV